MWICKVGVVSWAWYLSSLYRDGIYNNVPSKLHWFLTEQRVNYKLNRMIRLQFVCLFIWSLYNPAFCLGAPGGVQFQCLLSKRARFLKKLKLPRLWYWPRNARHIRQISSSKSAKLFTGLKLRCSASLLSPGQSEEGRERDPRGPALPSYVWSSWPFERPAASRHGLKVGKGWEEGESNSKEDRGRTKEESEEAEREWKWGRKQGILTGKTERRGRHQRGVTCKTHE